MVIEFPQEIIEKIVDHLAEDKATKTASLRNCSLVSSQWLHRSQKHMFYETSFAGARFSKWCEDVQPGDGGPSRHVVVLEFDNFPGPFANHHIHLSSFTNLQELCLYHTSIDGFTEPNEELSSCFKQIGRTVRSIYLRSSAMTINDLVFLVRHVVNLERLSLTDPIVYECVLDDSVELPVLGGVLKLSDLDCLHDRDFVHQLSLLPLAFHTVVLLGIDIHLSAAINELLGTCRETLERIDIPDNTPSESDVVRNINLTNFNALREMRLSARTVDDLHLLPPIIKTVTSPRLKEIKIILSAQSFEKYYWHLNEWELIDKEICTLIDRIRPTCYKDWRLSLRFVITSPTAIDTDAVGRSATRLLPASSSHKCIISTDFPGMVVEDT